MEVGRKILLRWEVDSEAFVREPGSFRVGSNCRDVKWAWQVPTDLPAEIAKANSSGVGRAAKASREVDLMSSSVMVMEEASERMDCAGVAEAGLGGLVTVGQLMTTRSGDRKLVRIFLSRQGMVHAKGRCCYQSVSGSKVNNDQVVM